MGSDETMHLVLETLQAAVKAAIEGTQLHIAYRDLEDLTTVSHRYDRKGVPCPLVPRKQKPRRVTLLFKLVHPIRDRPRDRNRPRGIEESYGNTRSSYRAGDRHGYHARDKDRSRSMKKARESESPLSRMDEETIEEFMKCFKIKTGRMKGAHECMRISGFMHEVNNPELTKRLNEHVPKTMEEMLTATTTFIRGETTAASKKKVHTPCKSQDQSKRHTSEQRSDFRNQPKDRRGSNKFTPLTRTPKEIFTAESGKFKPPSPMLWKQIKELVRAGKLSYFIKEIKQERDQQNTRKNDASVKDKSASIYMIWPWQRVTRQKVTQSFAHVKEITFQPLTANKGTEGPLVIEAKISGHAVHRIYAEARHKNFKVAIHPDFPDQEITIGGTILTKAQTKLCTLLKGNLDIFTWKPSDMTGVPRSIVKHRINIREGYSPVRQKKGADPRARQGNTSRAKGMFLGYMISPKGKKPCTDKTKAVLQLPSPRIIKEVQSLNGKLASLNRFLSKPAKKSLPLFKTLKKCIKKSDFHWTPEAEQAFKQMKQHLAKLPMLLAPKPKEELIRYLSASLRAISAVLMTERDTVQTPVYFVSRALQAPELNYTPMEKLVLALVCAAKRRRSTRGIGDRNFIRAVDTVHGRIIMCPGKVKFLIVAMDYFTKWIEAKAVATITGSQVKKFVWDSIVCRFGLPGEIVSNNERANRSLGEGIKAHLGEGNQNWLEELSHVLWAHRTMIKSSNNDTSFSLTYWTEADIPVEIRMPTYRTTVVDVVHNDEEIRLNLDLIEERRECAATCEAKTKLKITKYYNARVRGVTFRLRDFVYRSNDASHAVDGETWSEVGRTL
nr:reverse transcriptase domain-containing protein [Tanacetum cinerariifolium]